jgi:peptide/nickel transport system ATP-binding protein
MEDNLLLEVKHLKTHFFLDEGTVHAVEDATFDVERGATIGIVGESGCGKSVTAYSILQLVSKPGRIVSGDAIFHRPSGNGKPAEIINLTTLNPGSDQMRSIRGGEIAMIFQEPMNSLSPVHTVGEQIVEAILLHRDMTNAEARKEAARLLGLVGIPKPEMRVDSYTFQLSGGMRQRAMIAMALACTPSLLIADEPTTALDVTTQAQILELIQSLQEQFGMALILITHDLGVIAEVCDEVVVMYLGEVVEHSDVDSLFHDPLHPYTAALLRSIPKLGLSKDQRLDPIKGSIPDPYNRPTGCPFHPRCQEAVMGTCDVTHPELVEWPDGRAVRCLMRDPKQAKKKAEVE